MSNAAYIDDTRANALINPLTHFTDIIMFVGIYRNITFILFP